MSAQNKIGRNQMREAEGAVAEKVESKKSVEISQAEYNSLKAAAELIRHPDVLIRTLEAAGRNPGQSLDDAFENKHRHSRRRDRSA